MNDPRLENLAERAGEAFHTFSEEARKVRVLIEELPSPFSREEYEELLNQRLSETQALENYLQLGDQMFVYLKTRPPKEG